MTLNLWSPESGWGMKLYLHSPICLHCMVLTFTFMRQDSSVSIETRLWAGWPEFNFYQGQGFFSLPPHPDRLWGPPSLLSIGVRGSFPGGKWLGHEANHSTPYSAEVKIASSWTSIRPYVLMAWLPFQLYHSLQSGCFSEGLPRKICMSFTPKYSRIYKFLVCDTLLQNWNMVIICVLVEHLFENRVLRRIFGPNRESGGGLEKTARWGAL
jgi:hypothetical protein